MTPFRSDSPAARVLGIGLIALVALPLTIGSLRMSGRVIVPADDVVDEDLYALGGLVIIDGTVEGDVFAIAGDVRINGAVTGDVIALVGGPLDISGTVGGSVRTASVRFGLSGIVGDDVAVAALESRIGGALGRDLLGYGGETIVTGIVERDIRLQAVRLGIDGQVGRDVLVRVDRMTLGSGARVDGDLQYQASEDAVISDGAEVSGISTRREVLAPVWAKAVTRAVSVLSLFGLIVAGLVAMWLFRGTSAAAVRQAELHPWRSAAAGLGAMLVVPVLVVPLFLTLVGIPVALLLLVMWLVAILLGPIPAVTTFGSAILKRRGGLAAALVVGAVLWRASMWLLPLVAAFLYGTALLVGLGAYVRAGWELRQRHAM